MAPPNILNTVRDLERLRQIVGVLTRHGFGEMIDRIGLASLIPKRFKQANDDKSTGEKIRLVLQELGPSFIKLGQIVSTRPDLIPEDILCELKRLQDDVPPETFESIREVIEAELGGTIDEIFETFDEAPLASASIGQVHRGQIKLDGTLVDVAVKVQRPNVRHVMQRDIDLLYWLAHAMERSLPEAKLYHPVKLVSEFDKAVTAELDYMTEATHAERFAKNFRDNDVVRFPKVYRSASSRRVLTLEFLDGQKIDDAVAGGHNGEIIAKQSVDIIIKMIFRDGFFHADPHPGNVMILNSSTCDSPVIAMIDLGLVGRLSPQLRDQVVDLMVAVGRDDHRAIADALYVMGRPTKRVDRRAFEEDVAEIAESYLGKALNEIEFSAMISDLMDGARRYGLEVPPGLLMMGKTLMTVEGIGKEIYPELDVFEEVKPYFLDIMSERYNPERLTQEAIRNFSKLSNAANDIPLQVQDLLEDLKHGSFQLEVRERSLGIAADTLGRRIFSGLVVSAGMLCGTYLFSKGIVWIGGILFALSLGYAFNHTLLVMWKNRRRD